MYSLNFTRQGIQETVQAILPDDVLTYTRKGMYSMYHTIVYYITEL